MSGSAEPEPSEEKRPSGIHAVGAARPPEANLDAAEIAREASALVGDRPVLVLLSTSCGQGPRAAGAPQTPSAEDLGFPLALRLSAWLVEVNEPKMLTVPQYLRAWIDDTRAIVVPMTTPAWSAGALVVPADIDREAARALRDLACDRAVELEALDRRATLAMLAELDALG